MPEGRTADDDPSSYFGLALLRAISERFPGLPVIVLSSKDRSEVSRAFSAGGAIAFLPRDQRDSPELLRRYVDLHALVPDPSGVIVGNSIRLLQALRQARRVGATGMNVLIRGESGTGKELLAAYLNERGGAGRPFVAINCSTLSQELAEAELFGYVKGAYTDAKRDGAGKIALARNGDLFLDEIGALNTEVQAVLLRVLTDKVVTPKGGTKGEAVDVRFIAATDEDIEARASSGLFREALLFRLREGGTLVLPPLRERLDDLPDLVEALLRKAEARVAGARTRRVTPEALRKLESYRWPGNIRELNTVIGKAVVDYPDVDYLTPIHIDLPEGGSKGDLAKVIEMLEEFRFDGTNAEALRGRLRPLEEAFKMLLVRYVKACLDLQKGTPVVRGEKVGVPILQPVKWMVNDSSISTTDAKQLLRRIFRLEIFVNDPGLLESQLKDAELRALYDVVASGGKTP